MTDIAVERETVEPRELTGFERQFCALSDALNKAERDLEALAGHVRDIRAQADGLRRYAPDPGPDGTEGLEYGA